MSRQSKARRDQRKRKLRNKRMVRRSRPERRSDPVATARTMIAAGQWREARELLEDYDERYPGLRHVQRLLLDVFDNLEDYGAYCRACRRMLEQDPDDPELYAMLAGAHLHEGRPVAALRTFEQFVDRWPDHPFAQAARESMEGIQRIVGEMARESPFPEEDALDLTVVQLEIMESLAGGEHRRVIHLAEHLLARCPQFVPVMNNVAEAYFWTGQVEESIATSNRVLALEPENFHALSNLARHLLLSGRLEQAESTLARLQQVQSQEPDFWAKKAEVLSFFGDDQGVLDAFAQARRTGALTIGGPSTPLFYHLAAVASARQGEIKTARRYWQQALKINPGLALAQENLKNLEEPLEQRHGPWPYSMDHWIAKGTIDELLGTISDGHDVDDDAVADQARQFAERHPEIVALVQLLLDRGDPAGQDFARRFAMLLDTPPMHAALREFALGQRGLDQPRMEVASHLCSKGVLERFPVRMWIEGAWRELELLGFEVTDEPTGPVHAPQVEEWAYEAMQAIHHGDGVTAERLLVPAIEAEPHQVDLRNNLAMALRLQGRADEATALLREIHARWPDYLFARVGLAQQCLREGDDHRAEELLAPLRARTRLHHTEFAALCETYVRLFLVQMKFDAAESWFGMWADAQPGHPHLEQLEEAVRIGSLVQRLRELRARK